jgi:hypothetical protein
VSFHNVAITRSNSDFDGEGSNGEGNCGDIKVKNAERYYLLKTNFKPLGFFSIMHFARNGIPRLIAESIVFIHF